MFVRFATVILLPQCCSWFSSNLPIIFSFVFDMIMASALSSFENSGIVISLERELSDFDYPDDVVLLYEDQDKL